MNTKRIAHLSDIQIRFGSRHEEYRVVFERTYKDLESQKPDRIVVTGDLNHNKINMSPISIDLASEFLLNLSKIAPVDVIPGNHDLNLQQLSQGDSIEPLIKLMSNGYVVRLGNKDSINFTNRQGEYYGIYYFPETGLFDITSDLVYGHFSCIDGQSFILSPENKKKDKKYVALYHGTVYGSRNDNGYENKDITLMRLSTFDNFDIVALGDIHEYQTFRDDESAAFAGSLIQQNFGESIEKGYLVWNLENNSHSRRIVVNDWGFAKLHVSRGESLEERIEHIKFSNDKKRTKIWIEYEDFQENYSVEKENQIKKLIKEKYGCEVVDLNFREIHKNKNLELSEEEVEIYSQKPISELLPEWFIEKSEEHDLDDDLNQEIIALALDIDKKLEIKNDDYKLSKWFLKKMEVCNIFSFGGDPITFDFDKLQGISGIFGQNYSGKSNIIKALVWGLYQTILGSSDPSKLVNIYSGVDKGYVKLLIELSGKLYRIQRSVTRKKKKDGSYENSYSVEYTVLTEIKGPDGTLKKSWEKEMSDKATLEKTEVKKMIVDMIGTIDDFTKVSLQTQGGKEDYINQNQQPKNELIKRYVGLQHFSERYDFANETFKDIKKKQKELGDYKDLLLKVQDQEENINQQNKNLQSLEEEKRIATIQVDDLQTKLLELTSKLEKIEVLEEKNIEVVENKLVKLREEFGKNKKDITEVSEWLASNFKKELPHEIKETPEVLQSKINNNSAKFQKDKDNYLKIKSWLDTNFKQDEEDVSPLENKIEEVNIKIRGLKDKLPLYRGKACPTCGHVHEEAQPDLESKTLAKIKELELEVSTLRNSILEARNIISLNIKIDNEKLKLSSLEVSIRSTKKEIEDDKVLLERLNGMAGLIAHNSLVEEKTKILNTLRDKAEEIKISGEKLKGMLDKIRNNASKIELNKKVEEELSTVQDVIKIKKLNLYTIDQQIRNLSGDIRILNKELETLRSKISFIKDAEREYKKYSIYLQAVHRDGIPAQIIRKKLPLINSKINSVLRDIVEFKVSMEVLTNGDIVEYFYYNDDKSDAFPLSIASGAQKFIVSLAIKDALHYVSNLTKPSLCIIDEGFGALDTELRAKIQDVLNYLKNKYKNVLIISHEDQIKDFVDNVIEVSKTKNGIPEEYRTKYKKAWVTQVSTR